MVNISFDFNLFNNNYFFYERLVVILFSLVPALFLVWFVLYTDKQNKEPIKNVVICLLSGILTISLSGYLENLVMPYISSNTILTYVWAGIEEFSKIAIFFLFIFDNKHYDDIYDGLVYMCLIALSFAGFENILYAFSESTVQSSINLALMRDFTTIPLHVICGIVIGYFISLGNFSKLKNKRYYNFFLAILIPTLIHGTYNLLMGFLGKLNVDPSNTLLVLLVQTLPMLLIMIGLFYLAVKFSKKIVFLNHCFENNTPYDKEYSYLMNYDEYIESYDRRKRIKMYDKTSLKMRKKEEKEDEILEVDD